MVNEIKSNKKQRVQEIHILNNKKRKQGYDNGDVQATMLERSEYGVFFRSSIIHYSDWIRRLRDLPYLIRTLENTEPTKIQLCVNICDRYEEHILENISIFLINFDINNIYTE